MSAVYSVEEGGSLSKEISRWLDRPAMASVKYDGTNVSIGETSISGRNFRIDADTYQKVPIAHLRTGVSSTIVRDAISVASGIPVSELESPRIYGELLQQNLFNYEETGVLKTFVPFAVGVTSTNFLSVSERLTRTGFYPILAKGSDSVRIALSPALMDVFKATIGTVEGVSLPQVTASGTIRDVVKCENTRKFLMEHRGEGVIVSTSGGVYKWKISAEPQSSNVGAITNGIVSARSDSSIDPDVIPSLESMMAVATVGLDEGEVSRRKPKSFKPAKVNLLGRAIASVRSKIDLPQFDSYKDYEAAIVELVHADEDKPQISPAENLTRAVQRVLRQKPN